jgi:hypothetical protein
MQVTLTEIWSVFFNMLAIYLSVYFRISVPGCVISIATRYGLDVWGVRTLMGARFFAPVRIGFGTRPASCAIGTGSSLRVKRPGRGVDNPLLSSADATKRVKLCLCSTVCSCMACEVTFYLYLQINRERKISHSASDETGIWVSSRTLHIVRLW